MNEYLFIESEVRFQVKVFLIPGKVFIFCICELMKKV